MNSHKHPHKEPCENGQKVPFREKVWRFLGLGHMGPLARAAITAGAIAGISGVAAGSYAIMQNHAASKKVESAPMICSDHFQFKLPHAEDIAGQTGSGMDIWWQGDIFAKKGIRISDRIEEAKAMLSGRTRSGKEKFPVSGMPLSDRHSGFTTLHLAAMNLKTNGIEVITVEKNGSEKPRSTSHEGFNIKLVKANGVNSGFEIIKPPDYVVLAIKTPVLETNTSQGPASHFNNVKRQKPVKPKRSARRGDSFATCVNQFMGGRTSVSSAIYVPFQPEFAKSQELVTKGASHLKQVAEVAIRDVNSLNIPSLKGAMKVLSPDILFTMLVVERIEPERFVRGYRFGSEPGIVNFRKALDDYNSKHRLKISFSEKELQKLASNAGKILLADASGSYYIARNEHKRTYVYDLANSIESQIFEVLATVGANGDSAFRYAVSRTGARGIAQLMPETYCGIYDNYGKFGSMEGNFFKGTRDHLHSVTFQLLQKAESLSKVWKYVNPSREWLVISLAACYNYGWPRTLSAMSRSSGWAGSFREPWTDKDYDPEADKLKRKISWIKLRADALRKQIKSTSNRHARARWASELKIVLADMQAYSAAQKKIQAQFNERNKRYLPEETQKYVREAAAVFKAISEFRQNGLL